MANFERTTGMLQTHVRIVREIVERHIRVIEPQRAVALASLAFIEGVAVTLTSHKDERPLETEPLKAKRAAHQSGPREA